MFIAEEHMLIHVYMLHEIFSSLFHNSVFDPASSTLIIPNQYQCCYLCCASNSRPDPPLSPQAMFTSGLRESSMSSIKLQGVCSYTFSRLLLFAYTGEITVNEQTVCALLPAATMFQVGLTCPRQGHRVLGGRGRVCGWRTGLGGDRYVPGVWKCLLVCVVFVLFACGVSGRVCHDVRGMAVRGNACDFSQVLTYQYRFESRSNLDPNSPNKLMTRYRLEL